MPKVSNALFISEYTLRRPTTQRREIYGSSRESVHHAYQRILNFDLVARTDAEADADALASVSSVVQRDKETFGNILETGRNLSTCAGGC